MAGENILVIDDAKNVRDTFTSLFDEYNIIAVGSAQEALNILRRLNDIDLIVLDVMMPDMNGLELLAEIKKINTYAKVIIMTGYSSKDIAIEALRRNADEYVEKPFDIDEIKEIFERLLGENRNLNEAGVSDTQKKIRRAQRLIERNYNKSLSLQDIAKEVFLDYKYFSRIFKEKSGKTFNAYKLGLRIASAKQLLRKCSYTVSQIAYKVGYQNPDSFMKMFKRLTGLTPSEYRNRSRQKKKRKKEVCRSGPTGNLLMREVKNRRR